MEHIMKKLGILGALLLCVNAHATYNALLKIPRGGTNAASLAGHGVLIMNSAGDTATSVAPGTAGHALISDGTNWSSAAITGFALTDLSNVSATAVAASLIPGTDNSIDLGSSSKRWATEYVTAINSGNATKLSVTTQGLVLPPWNTLAGMTGTIYFGELAANGTDTVAIRAPDSIGTSYFLTLPTTAGTSGQCLSTSGSGGVLSWVSCGTSTYTVTNAGDADYTVLATDSEVRSTTTLTAARAWNLPACSTNIGELHVLKKTDSSAFVPTVTPNGSDTIDGAASYPLSSQYDSVSIVCAVSGNWDIQ